MLKNYSSTILRSQHRTRFTFSSELGRTAQRLKQPCRNKKLQACRTHYFAACPAGGRGQDPKTISQPGVSEPSYPHTSQGPLRLLIKVSGQRDGLGISIAGGRGSTPFIKNDEGIFISKVSKGGPAEKAGVHIGDRVLEVNGQDMQGVSHHEAVSTLRLAGTCIKMKVLRQRLEPDEDRVSHEPEDSNTGLLIGCKGNAISCSALANRIDAVVCNGKSMSDLGQDRAAEQSSLQVGLNAMTIPRIILTRPSTSDEDGDVLTLGGVEEINNPDNHIYSDFNSAFYTP